MRTEFPRSGFVRNRVVSILAGLLTCGVILGAAADQGSPQAADFVRLTPEQVRWQAVPGSPGVQMATVAGDPSSHGVYVQRVRFPPHVMDRPHWHPGDRYITVLKGTWYTGTGATFDPKNAVPLKAGSFMFHPAKGVHWDGSMSDEEVVVQIFGLGPVETVAADPGKPFWVQVKP